MRTLLAMSVLGLGLLLGTNGYAQTKLAVVNSREILTKCDAGAKIVQEIREAFASRRQEADKLRNWAQQLQKEATSLGTKETRKKEIQAELVQIGAKLQRFTRDVAQEENTRFKPVVEKVNAALAAYAKEQGFSGIQDRSNYVYVAPSMDITQEIIKKVNQMP